MPRFPGRAAALAVLLLSILMADGACASKRDEIEPFPWLEDRHGERALGWVAAQNAEVAKRLQSDGRFEPYRKAAFDAASLSKVAAGWFVGEGWINRIFRDSRHERGIWQRASFAKFAATGKLGWESILDFDALSATERKDWFPAGDVAGTLNCRPASPSRCLVALAEKGRDVGDAVREFDVGARQFIPNGFEVRDSSPFWIQWWDADTVLVAPNLGPQTMTSGPMASPFTVRLWRRGTSIASAREIWRGSPQDADRVLLLGYPDESGRRHLVIRQQHNARSRTHWILDDRARPIRMDVPMDAMILAAYHGQLIFTIESDWRSRDRTYKAGSLLSHPVGSGGGPGSRVRLVREPGDRDASLSKFDVRSTHAGLLVTPYIDMIPRVLRYRFDGSEWHKRELLLGQRETLRIELSDVSSPYAIAMRESFVEPPRLWRIDVSGGASQPFGETENSRDAESYVVESAKAKSADGVLVPFSVVRAKDMRYDGSAPTLLYAYGGNMGSKWPTFSPLVNDLWLRKGGIYVLANVRGGAEFGPSWHQAAVKANKQRAVDDVIAVAEELVNRRMTSPRRLGIEGESTGGLVMGAVLVQRPDLIHAAVLDVPELDMLRYVELGGARHTEEYGSPSVPSELEALRAISPYANLRRRSGFPLPLVMSSTEDGIVHPAHARKFVAKLESLGMKGLYYESPTGGHYRKQLPPADSARVEAYRFVYLAQRLMD